MPRQVKYIIMMENIKAFKQIIKYLLYLLDGKKRRAFAVLISMILTSGLELLGVSAIYPFLQVVLTPDEMRGKWYMQCLATFFPNLSNQKMMIFAGVFIIIIFFLKNAVALKFTYLQSKFAVEFQRDESVEMLDSYMKRPYQFFVNTNSAELLRGINGDTASAYYVLLYMFQLVGEMLTIILIGLFLIKTDCFIAVGSLLLVAFCSLGIIMGFKEKMKTAGKLNRLANKERNKYSYQAINGIKEITVLDRRELFVDQYRAAAQKTADSSLANSFYSAAPDRILEGVCIGGVMTIICIRLAMGIDLETFIPSIGTFAMGAFKILPSASKISTRLNGIIYQWPGLKSCYENISYARQLDKERDETLVTIKETETREGNGKLEFVENLSIEKISWKYQNAKEKTLYDLNLTIKKGEAVAFIGSSGAGKTTLADIILGLLKPQAGVVKMDGIDVYAIPHQWAKIIGYVPQSVFLIDDTIRANVAFGLPADGISDAKIWFALEQAQLKSFVASLPKGLETIVGERGVKFSGGQRQRVAIARALYEDPDILVLDEATSALDTETETAVMEAIDALQGRKTLIIVAHRLTTIKNCDRIYEIEDGKVVERLKSEIF